MTTTKVLVTTCLLSLVQLLEGCAPCEVIDPQVCDAVVNSQVLDSSEAPQPGYLEVHQGVDAVGTSFQTTNLLVGTVEDLGTRTVVLHLNDQRQVTTVWNGRLLGVGRPIPVSGDEVETSCSGLGFFWHLPVGFGTIGSRDQGFSVVGHPLTEGQMVRVQVDVCNGNVCAPGTPRVLRVHLVP